MKIKLKSLISESWTDKGKGLTKEQKRSFLESVSRFNGFGKSIYREANLKELSEALSNIVETAKELTMQESEGTFDSISVGRHMKSLEESMKLFNKTAMEMATLQQRLESCFEDCGQILNRYYDIHEIQESLDAIKEDVQRKLNKSEQAQYTKQYKYVSDNYEVIKPGTKVMHNGMERTIAQVGDKTLRVYGDYRWHAISDVKFKI